MTAAAFLVIGGGPAGLAAVRAYRQGGGRGDVVMVSSDHDAPYARPPLSKGFLDGSFARDDLPLESSRWYAAHGVDLRLERAAVSLDPDRRRVALDDAEPLFFTRCLLATGSEPRRPPVPGGADPAVLTLRTVSDAERLIDRARPGARAVVIGSGFIGCEAASSLARRGCRVTLVSPERVPQEERLGPEVGERIAGWLREDGVELRLGCQVEAIEGGRLVTLEGGPGLEADVLLAAVGVTPRTALAETAGLEVSADGVLTDASMRTAAPGVFAAGDVAHAHSPIAGRRLAVEHWGEAHAMGTVAGTVAAGREAAWEQAPGFWSTIGGRTLKHVAWGDGFDEARMMEGDDGAFAVWYGRDGELVGVLSHGLDAAYEQGRELVEARAPFRLPSLEPRSPAGG